MIEIGLFIAGFLACSFLVLLACVGHWMRHAEIGVDFSEDGDPMPDLPTFDDDEADRLLEQGA